MMDEVDDLKNRYIASFPDKLRMLEATWEQAKDDSRYLTRLNTLVHQIAGSGGSYGFAELSYAAFALDNKIRELLEHPTPPPVESYLEANWQCLCDILQQLINGPEDIPAIETNTNRLNQVKETACIFLIEDNPDQAVPVVKLLNEQGYRVEYFSGTNGVKQAIDQNKPTLLIIDITLSEGKNAGLRFAESLQQNPDCPPILFLSESNEFQTHLQAIKTDAAGFIAKPYTLSTLTQHIDRIFLSSLNNDARVLLLGHRNSECFRFQHAFNTFGIEATTVTDPTSISSYLLEYQPDCVLLDEEQEGCTGLEVAQIIRQGNCYSEVPVIIFSENMTLDGEVKAIEHAVDAYMPMDSETTSLVPQIQARILRHQQQVHMLDDDPLTGLLNKKAFFQRAAGSIARSQRLKQPFCIAMADIDHFKQLNERYGHHAGDGILREVASRLQKLLRNTDLIGRFNDDKFVLLLPEISSKDAEYLISRVQEYFSRTPYFIRHANLLISLSIGLVSVETETAPSSLIRLTDDMLELAGKTLYDAKSIKRGQYRLTNWTATK